MEQPDHILVVDDDAEIRRMVADYLRKNGLRATEVADGREMRAALETSAVDLIVLDLMMPGEDGLSLARNLRAGKHKAIPVIMLTARDDATDKIIGLEMGADDYITKPFASRELLARISTGDFSNQAFPFATMRAIDIGYARVLAGRITYVGELGWELHIPTEYVAYVYETLREAGAEFGITDAGYKAINSLRMEKR